MKESIMSIAIMVFIGLILIDFVGLLITFILDTAGIQTLSGYAREHLWFAALIIGVQIALVVSMFFHLYIGGRP